MRALVVLLVGMCVILAVVGWTEQRGSVLHPLENPPDSTETAVTVLKAILFFGATLLGIVFRQVHVHFEGVNADRHVNLWTELAAAIRRPKLVSGIIVSPIVFGAAYALVGSHPSLILAVIMAFENGFFWEAVLERRRGESAKVPVPATADQTIIRSRE